MRIRKRFRRRLNKSCNLTKGGRELTPGAYLKEHTAAAHVATERLLLGDDGALRAGRLTLDRYQRLITTTAKVWAAAREAFAEFPHYPEYQAIINDLVAAAARDEALLASKFVPDLRLGPLPQTRWPQFPAIADSATALGSMYVLLGSTLGGKMIARVLGESPELQQLPRYYFYEACSAVPPTTWPDFQRALTAAITSEADLLRCGEQALATFALYSSVYPSK